MADYWLDFPMYDKQFNTLEKARAGAVKLLEEYYWNDNVKIVYGRRICGRVIKGFGKNGIAWYYKVHNGDTYEIYKNGRKK